MLKACAKVGSSYASADRAGRHRIAVLAATFVVVAMTVAATLVSVQTTSANAAAITWGLSTTQMEQAIGVAYLEASSTIPGSNGAPLTGLTSAAPIDGPALITYAANPSTWPSNVDRVSCLGTDRQTASQYVDGSMTPDNRPTFVVRMTGQFSVPITAPEGASTYATGTVLTAVIDALTGQVLDFGVDTSGVSLPNPMVVFQR